MPHKVGVFLSEPKDYFSHIAIRRVKGKNFSLFFAI